VLVALLGSMVINQQYAQNTNQNVQIKTPSVLEPEILGNTSKGTVTKSGPYGNLNSNRKIAIIVGVHPIEANSHRAMVASILILSESLNSSYYIYKINVAKDASSYNKGRMNGQLLANKYAVPDIKKNHFQLVIDVHSNRGKYAGYKKNRFLSVPVKSKKSKLIASKIITKAPWLVYYIPPSGKGPKSPRYVTIPLIKSGTPAIVYETYTYDTYKIMVKHASKFIRAVDTIKLN